MTVTHEKSQRSAAGDDGSAGRRITMLALVGIGTFLVIGSLLLRFYAYPKLAIAPIDQDSVTKAEAKGATILDIATLKTITTDLSLEQTTVGDVKASEEAGGDTRVFVGTSSVRSSDGEVRSRSAERTPMDGVTAEAINCCDAFYESTDGERTPATRSGLVWKFPFDTQQQSYQVWDESLGAAVKFDYKGKDEIDGLSVYKFEGSVPDTVVGEPTDVPSTVFGESVATVVPADNHYQSSTTYWIEPHTGVIIDRTTDLKEWLQAGDQQVTKQAGTFSYTDAQVADNVDSYSTKATLLGLVHGVAIWILLALGLILLGVGLMLKLRPRART